MGLITKEVEVKLSNKIIKHYEDLGYEIPRYFNKNNNKYMVKRGTKILVKTEHLTDGSDIKVDVKCDHCGKTLENILWTNYKNYIKDDGKYYCKSCSNKLYGRGFQKRLTENEIRKIIDKSLGVDYKIIKVINTDKRTYVDLLDSIGYKYGNVDIQTLKRSNTSKFSKSNKYTKENINNWCKLNSLNIELINNYKDVNKKLNWKCLDCNNIFKRSWDDIYQSKISCPNCGDGISYPEKFGLFLFNQLNVYYIYNSIANWSKNKRYDFIFNDLKIVIEFHGLQHYNGGFESYGGRTLEEELENDKLKKELSECNGYKYIDIDCRKSELEWIKNNILNSELNNIFNLSNINWLECHEYAIKNNLIKETCDLWNNEIKMTSKISEILKLSDSTIRRYLKQGAELGWCDYDAIEACKKNNIRRFKPVIQLSLNGEYIQQFNSMINAEEQTGIISISSCCRGKIKSAGGFKWMYKSEYEKLTG